MASGQKEAVLHHLSRLLRNGTVAGLSEWQLLERYLSQRDEAAFEALVARHGPMVLGVCRRILGNSSEVDDAFQATFLILVKKAGSLGERDAIGHWLYGVAHRVALRARTIAAKRRAKQPGLAVLSETREGGSSSPELGWLLEEELSRLPGHYRAPVVLCYLQGMTHEEAARRLHWPLGTVKGRLARARALLKDRLVRRGIAPTAGTAITSLSRDASAQVPEILLHSTVATAMRLVGGTTTFQAIPATVAALLPGVFTTMFITRIKVASVIVSVAIIASAGFAAAEYANERSARRGVQPTFQVPDPATPQQNQRETSSSSTTTAQEKAEQPHQTKDQTPANAPDIALRDQKENLATKIFESELEQLKDRPTADIDVISQWSKKILDTANERSQDKINPLEQHLRRMKQVVDAVKNRSDREFVGLKAQFYVAEAELLLAQAKQGPHATNFSKEGRYIPGSQSDPGSQSILKALEKTSSFSFPNETPLEEILKYFKKKTITPEFPNGIPIYVDPIGLQEAEKTLITPVTLDVERIPLKTAIWLIVEQLGMIYEVDGGVLRITSTSSERAPLTPILALADRASRGELSIEEMKDVIEKYKLIFEIRRYSEGFAPESKSSSPK